MGTLQDNPKLVLLAIPGSLVWLLIILGVALEKDVLIGAGIALVLVILVIGFAINGVSSSKDKAEKRRIWAEGLPGVARIVSIEKQGAFNDHPYVVFELEVSEGGDSWTVQTKQLISELAIPRIQPEMTIDVRVDGEDRDKIALDPALTPYGYD